MFHIIYVNPNKYKLLRKHIFKKNILKKKKKRSGEDDREKNYGKIVIIAITMLFDK